MLTLKDIRKEYDMGENVVHALRGVSIDFRDSEFVAILGPSGCGKTTLLNIIGGLDGYTSGDLVIDGTSTREFRDAQWDAYRNHSVGFVFQSYNLIPHQSVLANVELALKLSHELSVAERRDRAMRALEKVGLADQASKRPSMMSGGQMQRVAIARALVNDPAIILADEPTGALDSETSVQVMDILREIARDRLVIMVTHNPELAEQYATRIVRLKDGQVVGDTNPVAATELGSQTGTLPRRTRLGLGTALGLSLQNLLTKRGRTFLTAFAGAIGIIGIALILALSNGVNDYIQSVEQDTMGNYPIELERQTIAIDLTVREPVPLGSAGEQARALDAVYSQNVVADTVRQEESMMVENDLAAFKAYLEGNIGFIADDVSAVEYGYAITPQVYRADHTDDQATVTKVSPSSLLGEGSSGGFSMGGMSVGSSTSSAWQQLPSSEALRERGYELLAGQWPTSAQEAVLVVNEDNQVSDYVLYTLGLMDADHLEEVVEAARAGEEVDDPQVRFEYEDVLGLEFCVLAPTQLYQENEDGVWVDMSSDDDFLAGAVGEGIPVSIVGVIRMGEDAQLNSGVAYDARLVGQLMDVVANSDIVTQQLADPTTNVLTGEPFEEDESSEDDASGDESEVQQASSFVEGSASGTMLLRVALEGDLGEQALVGDVSPDDTAEPLGAETIPADEDPTKPTTMDGTDEPAPDDPDPDDPDDPMPDDPVEKTYRVRFLNYDDSVLSTPHEYSAGDAIDNLPESDPERPGDLTQTYLFIGWVSHTDDPTTDGRYYVTRDLPAVSGAADYKALYYAMPVSRTDVPGTTNPGDPSATLPDGASQVTPNMDALSGLSGMDAAGLAGMDLSQYMNGTGRTSGYDLSALSGLDLSALAGTDGASASGIDLSGYDLSGYDLDGYDLDEITGSALGEGLSDGQLQAILQGMSSSTPSTYAGVLDALGYVTADQPSSIAIYPVDFDGKALVEDFIAAYNEQAGEDEQVTYTDIVGLMISSVTSIVNMISYVLIAFVAISLVVSSIMIAIITYISVLERTKEIGVLRALGASKGDVSKIFNAETLIEGLLAGLIGVGVTLALCVPINRVVAGMTGVTGIAHLPAVAGVALVGISVLLTLVAGFVPSRVAARKDPAVALRSE